MKVICIDGAKHKDSTGPETELPIEGVGYNAHESFYDNYYTLEEIPFNKVGRATYFKKSRFIPLSTIDETEIHSKTEKQLL